MEAEGTLRLRRVLQAIAWTIPAVGYCQGMGMVAGVLLLVMEEDEAFWTMRSLLIKKLPKDYYSPTLLGVMVDQRVLRDLIGTNEPTVGKLLDENGVEISLITLNWFLTCYSNVAPLHTVMRVWDWQVNAHTLGNRVHGRGRDWWWWRWCVCVCVCVCGGVAYQRHAACSVAR